MPDSPGESEPVKTDPGDLARVLELELLQKRAAWQNGIARRRLARAVSILFLVIVLGIAIFAISSLFHRLNSGSAPRPPSAVPTGSP